MKYAAIDSANFAAYFNAQEAAFTIHDLGGQRVLVDSVPPKQLAAAIETGGAQLDNLAKAQAIFQR